MAWYDLVENPKAISALYTMVPELNAVHILELGFEELGSIKIMMDLPSFPDTIPQRWKWQGYNSILLQMRFSSMIAFQLERWGTTELVRFHMNKSEKSVISFNVDAETCAFQGRANYAYITIQKVVIK